MELVLDDCNEKGEFTEDRKCNKEATKENDWPGISFVTLLSSGRQELVTQCHTPHMCTFCGINDHDYDIKQQDFALIENLPTCIHNVGYPHVTTNPHCTRKERQAEAVHSKHFFGNSSGGETLNIMSDSSQEDCYIHIINTTPSDSLHNRYINLECDESMPKSPQLISPIELRDIESLTAAVRIGSEQVKRTLDMPDIVELADYPYKNSFPIPSKTKAGDTETDARKTSTWNEILKDKAPTFCELMETTGKRKADFKDNQFVSILKEKSPRNINSKGTDASSSSVLPSEILSFCPKRTIHRKRTPNKVQWSKRKPIMQKDAVEISGWPTCNNSVLLKSVHEKIENEQNVSTTGTTLQGYSQKTKLPFWSGSNLRKTFDARSKHVSETESEEITLRNAQASDTNDSA